MAELKPCPFCGGDGTLWSIDQCQSVYAVCQNCGMRTIDYKHAKEAIAAWNRRAQPENAPLTLDEMNALDHEPIYVLHTGGKWTMNGWHIATASSYQNHGRCDLEIDNGNTIIDMQNYGNTWLAYRYKKE